jgi:hypothetical protein
MSYKQYVMLSSHDTNITSPPRGLQFYGGKHSDILIKFIPVQLIADQDQPNPT